MRTIMTGKQSAQCLAVILLLLIGSPVVSQQSSLIPVVNKLEESLEARIGMTVHDMHSGKRWNYRGDERFPMSSTFKPLACGALLRRVDQGVERLEREVTFGENDLVTYSPVTESRVGSGGMSLDELCEAAVTVSDNTAGNLVLRSIGGPEALTRFLRSIGDDITRLDRWETDLNEAIPGDSRDTTTPNAMAGLLEELLIGSVLTEDSRSRLQGWMTGNTVGDDLFRAGIPADWVIADKSGAGGYGSRSISAVMWPPGHRPVIAVVYLTQTKASFEDRNAAIAAIGKAIAAELSAQTRNHHDSASQ